MGFDFHFASNVNVGGLSQEHKVYFPLELQFFYDEWNSGSGNVPRRWDPSMSRFLLVKIVEACLRPLGFSTITMHGILNCVSPLKK